MEKTPRAAKYRDWTRRETISFTERITRQSNVLSLAADLRGAYKRFLFQAEIVAQRRKFTEKGRPGGVNPLVGEWAAPQDDMMWGAYGLTGYRFAWLGIMPYLILNNLTLRDPSTLSQINSQALGRD